MPAIRWRWGQFRVSKWGQLSISKSRRARRHESRHSRSSLQRRFDAFARISSYPRSVYGHDTQAHHSGSLSKARALAKTAGQDTDAYLRVNGLDRYTEPSVKGSADIDWSDELARSRVLTDIVVDAKRLLSLAGSHATDAVRDAAKLLEQLMLQDVETKKGDDGSEQSNIIEGTANGRMPSATDPDVRHGRKSSSKRFNGHKADIAVDLESGTIVAFNVLPGDAADASGALELVEQVEHNTQMHVEETAADCAYGGGPTRQQFEDADRVLLAKVPAECCRNGLYPKSAFKIDLKNDTVTCPAGHTVSTLFKDETGKHFRFGSQCSQCPLRSLCTKAKSGRTVTVHPQEDAMQQARRYQQTPEGRATLRKRVIVEHRLARLAQLGIGQARYKGRKKTRLQLMMACAIANFRLAWNHRARTQANSGQSMPICALVSRLYSALQAPHDAGIGRTPDYMATIANSAAIGCRSLKCR